MNCFGFEDQYTMFGMTPVDNQFILEYLPTAKGDDVRVYLYGLMQCYHPQEDMTLEKMARELHMEEEEVLAAYRRWERKGFVQRISDKPPRFRYVSLKRLFFMGGQIPVDEEYERFAEALYAAFGHDHKLPGKDVSTFYEWVEDPKMALPQEVVIRLVEHMIALHGKKFSMKAAQKLASILAEEKCRTVEDANDILSRDMAVWTGAKDVLRRLGLRRNPTEDESRLYRKWMLDWGFDGEAILAACAETVKSANPNFAYLDGILKRHHAQYQTDTTSGTQMEKRLEQEHDRPAALKALLSVLGLPTTMINDGTLAVYDEMRALYPDNIILIAGRECARHGLKLDDVQHTLESWQKRQLMTVEAIEADLKEVGELNAFLQELYALWNTDHKPNAAHRALVKKWRSAWGLADSFIVCCAAWAQEQKEPMKYLNAILTSMRKKGISTIEAAVAEHEKFSGQKEKQGKTVGEQQYTQREYTHDINEAYELMGLTPEDVKDEN